jgi:glycosyltransferase involved in cell wall biosynthesis
MEIAYYYHYPVYVSSSNQLYLPGYVGCFVDALAKEVTKLILIAHTSTENNSTQNDWELQEGNIELLDIGKKTPAWHRHIFHRSILSKIAQSLNATDVLLVRSPTPLAPFFSSYLKKAKLVYLVVGDYEESLRTMKGSGIRHWLMKQYILRNNRLFRREMKHTDVLVNSPELFAKYSGHTKSIHQIKTTTLTEKDFYNRASSELNQPIKVLYTGRITESKGLFELIEAVANLSKQAYKIECHIVGWEEGRERKVEMKLMELATSLQIADQIFFHGKKKLGDELNAIYRSCDIYCIPSYQEGFPRTIWEAMANGLPIIATKVGAIPHYLEHERNALLIEPRSVNDITQSLLRVIKEETLRQELIQQGYALAKQNTLEIQTKKLVGILSGL